MALKIANYSLLSTDYAVVLVGRTLHIWFLIWLYWKGYIIICILQIGNLQLDKFNSLPLTTRQGASKNFLSIQALH